MLNYPQLSTGTVAQYPLRKIISTRTIANECIDGRVVKLADISAGLIQWELHYFSLTQTEWNKLSALFQSTQGRLQTFVFLDPTDNLLRFTETLGSSVWQKDGQLEITTAVSDPRGTTRASRLTNTASIDQTISQTVSAAGWYRYAFSVYMRSASPVPVGLSRRTTDGVESQIELIGTDWRRVESSGEIEGTAVSIDFALSIPAGASVDVFGFQAEAQVQPSEYKMTGSQSGVYSASRFMEDALSPVAVGPNDYSVQVRLTSKAGS